MERTVEQMLETVDEPNRQPAELFWNDLKTHIPKADRTSPID